MRKVLVVALIAIIVSVSLPCNAEDVFIVDGIRYESYDGSNTCEVTGYVGTSTYLAIPSIVYHNGKQMSVIKIKYDAFKEQKAIKSIILPNSIQSIGIAAFEGCSSLTSVTIPNSVVKIDKCAFQNCSSLDNVDIPASISVIENHVFYGCTSLKKITFQGKITHIGRYAFYNCGFKEFNIPTSVIRIDGDAFCDCKELKQIYIPASVTSLGVIDYSNSTHSFDCEVTVSTDNPNYCSEEGVLYNKDKTVLYRYPTTKNDKKYNVLQTVKEIQSNAFEDCQFEEIAIPNSVKRIEGWTFKNCYNLKSISILSVEEICKCAFLQCESLSEVTFSPLLKRIGWGAFSKCKSLSTLSIPNTVTTIDENAFSDCFNLSKIILPDKAYISSRCFHDCPNIDEVKGYTVLYPDIVANGIFDSSCPFYQMIVKNFSKVKKSFSYYAFGKVNSFILEWQKKKEYETTEQWRLRVTEKKRQQKVNELLDEARKEYVANNAPNTFNGTLGNYDADYNTFPLKVGEQQMLFISVPQSDAPLFKEKWNKVKVSPTYGIVNDYVGVLSCTFTLKGKTYNLSKTYNNDNADNLALNLSPFELNFGDNREEKASSPITIDNSLDLNIPSVSSNNTITFAVIIGNERYTRVAQVPYANNDARIFAEYCKKTLGLPDKNVKVYENATYGAMIGAVSDIQKIAKAFKGDANIIFYYAGHGIPDEATGDGYLLPIDADGLNMRVCYPLSQLYKELGEMQARSVTCFLDACFSGSQRGDGMVVAARGVAIKAKSDRPTGHTIVFTAATDKQTAYPYKEKGHGMFTYYLLKKLRDTKGDCTLGELGTYICDEVAKQAVVTNGKEQTPVILTSDGVQDDWKNMKLK